MNFEEIPLWNDKSIESRLKYCPCADSLPRPAMLVVPGGGYGCVCHTTEGEPVAEKFAGLGFAVFILHYRVAPHRYPTPQKDIIRAMRMIRANAKKWNVIPDNIAACGFSAGGHLVASAGTMSDSINADNGDSADAESGRPDAMVLCYPVTSFAKHGHSGSGKNLLGEDYDALQGKFDLTKLVGKKTPPAFIWHTAEDQTVPVANSMRFANAMHKRKRPYELHVFPFGPHGMQLGYGRQDISLWPDQAKAFLQGSCGFRFPEKNTSRRTIVLTFDDACKSHLSNVAPILKKYGFGATFFISRFNDEWRRKNEAFLLTAEETAELHKMGLEIGNHTWNHPDMRNCSDTQCAMELDSLNKFLSDAGIPPPVSFAYPGGPFAENAVGTLREKNFAAARTTERKAWDVKNDDPMRIPAIPIQGEDVLAFYHAVALADGGNPVVLVFHGVPDDVHGFVSTPPEIFEKYMEYLFNNDFEVVSLKDCLQRK